MSWLPGPLLKQGRIGVWPPLMILLWLAAAAALAQGTDSGYRLGPGDRIIIKVFGEEDLSMDFRLNDTGRLNYPFLGEASRSPNWSSALPAGSGVPISATRQSRYRSPSIGHFSCTARYKNRAAFPINRD